SESLGPLALKTMNNPMQQAGPMGMNQMVQPNPVLLHPVQPQMQQPQEKQDNISKVKLLMGPLRDSLALALKTAAQTLHQNSLVDTSKGIDPPDHRFNKNIEEFYSICDQIELHLRTSIECLGQNSSSNKYMPVSVIPSRTEMIGPGVPQDALTYPQYLMTVKSQVQYTKDIYNLLYNAARSITPSEQPPA
ncbi:mediator of RNA polymerase II transcription subunit 29, partial [Copidosoma floridanum]|uniref:mediator of RNA polymerase II transcription subunit 29 n=1 Tax=Copidosoma floridanum TaxID=29053 RepID=UPI000C6F639D